MGQQEQTKQAVLMMQEPTRLLEVLMVQGQMTRAQVQKTLEQMILPEALTIEVLPRLLEPTKQAVLMMQEPTRLLEVLMAQGQTTRALVQKTLEQMILQEALTTKVLPRLLEPTKLEVQKILVRRRMAPKILQEQRWRAQMKPEPQLRKLERLSVRMKQVVLVAPKMQGLTKLEQN